LRLYIKGNERLRGYIRTTPPTQHTNHSTRQQPPKPRTTQNRYSANLLTSGTSPSVTNPLILLPSITEYRAMLPRSTVLQPNDFLALRNTPGSSQTLSSLIISKSLNTLTISLGFITPVIMWV